MCSRCDCDFGRMKTNAWLIRNGGFASLPRLSRAAGVLQPFHAIHNPFTANYALLQSENGVSAIIDVDAAPQSVYFNADLLSNSQDCTLNLVLQLNKPFTQAQVPGASFPGLIVVPGDGAHS